MIACNDTMKYSAASGAPTLIDAFAQSADKRFPQPHHPPKAIFPNLSATTEKGHRGHILGRGGSTNFLKGFFSLYPYIWGRFFFCRLGGVSLYEKKIPLSIALLVYNE